MYQEEIEIEIPSQTMICQEKYRCNLAGMEKGECFIHVRIKHEDVLR